MDVNQDFIESGSLRIPLKLRFLFLLDKALRLPAMRKDGTINRRLSDLLDFKAPPLKQPAHGVSSKDIVTDTGTGVWVRIYTPSKEPNKTSSTEQEATADPMPIIFYFHGGGFAILRANFIHYDAFCKRLCKICTATVISVDYRRSPEHRYPVPYEDCFSALKWLQSDAAREHIPPHVEISRCFLMGDSAGGNIVHHVSCMAAAAEENLNPVKVIGSMVLFPFFGGEERTPAEERLRTSPIGSERILDWFWQAYLPKGSNRDHPAANVSGPDAPDLCKQPLAPCMVVIAEFDRCKDWQLRYCRKLSESGKQVQLEYCKGGFHCFHVFPQLDMASQLLTTMQEFVKARCGDVRAKTMAA